MFGESGMRIDFEIIAEYTSYPGNPGRTRGPAEECEEPFGPSVDVWNVRLVGARLTDPKFFGECAYPTSRAVAAGFLPTLAKLSNIQPEDCATAILKSL